MKKLFSLLAALLLAAAGYAQDDTPFFSEDFEGSSHAFTIVNGTQTNKWHVGRATAKGGSKAAYVSNDGGATNAYSLTTSSTVHMYADVTFPAEKFGFALSFDWVGVGEGRFDNLSVYVEETSVTPTAGSISGLGTALATFKEQSTWQQAKVYFPQSYAGTTKRLVFTWKNDGSYGAQPPMAVDNLALTASSSIQGATGNFTWVLTADSTLTISGSGAMPNYYNGSYQPWNSYRSFIKSVVVAEGITTIGNYAFYGCSGLTSITIPEGVTAIGNAAFYQCSNLSSVTIPEGVTSIGNSAFYGCSGLTAIEVAAANAKYSSQDGVLFNKNKTTLIQHPAGKSGATYAIPEGVTTIGELAFSDCRGLTEVTIPEGVTSIGSEAFYNCRSLTSIAVAAGNPNYVSQDSVLFSKDKTTLVLYPAGNKTGAYAIPGSVDTIDSRAFYYCANLRSVTIPSSVTSIGSEAFGYCSGLTEVVALNPQPVISDNIFYYASQSLLKVPAESISLYEASEGWKNFTNIVGIAANNSVTFNAQGGSSVVAQTVEYGSTATEPATPTKPGYTFGGWYREADCTNEWDFATDMVTRDTTLYAQWTIKTYTVTIADVTNGAIVVKNGAAVVASGASLDSGTVLTLQATPNAGYKLAKWWDDSTSTNRSYTLSSEVSISATFTAVAVTGVSLNKTATTLLVDGTETLTSTVQPDNALNKSVTWSSSNTAVATVSSAGLITAKAAGTATITATTEDGSKAASCTVTITQSSSGGGNTTAVSANELLPLTLYPTVTNGQLIIDNEQWGSVIASEAKQSQAIEIYSLSSGALVAKVPTAGEQTSINISHLPNGTYVVRVGKYAGKVVKR